MGGTKSLGCHIHRCFKVGLLARAESLGNDRHALTRPVTDRRSGGTKHFLKQVALVVLGINVAGILPPTPAEHDLGAFNDARHIVEVCLALCASNGNHIVI